MESVNNKGFSLNQFCALNPDKRKQEYCMEKENGKRGRIDATLEPFSQHPGRSRFGRLSNHVSFTKKEGKGNSKCNLRPSICVATRYFMVRDLKMGMCF